MFNQSYEEYMQNVLGFPTNYNNTYTPMSDNYCYCNNMYEGRANINVNLEECYPEIYTIIYPMVQKACMKNTRALSKELVEEMTEEIYNAIEPNDPINVNINITNNTRAANNNVEDKTVKQGVKENNNAKQRETRQGNFLLKDLITILLLRELTGRPGNRPPHRPPMRPNPPHRPPFPGPDRPPIMPRYYDIYEY